MREVIICERCGAENPTSHLECWKCEFEFVNAKKTLVPDEEERAMEHDFAPENIEEGICVECGAKNPAVVGLCLFCGGSLKEIATHPALVDWQEVEKGQTPAKEKVSVERNHVVEVEGDQMEPVICGRLVDVREKKTMFELSEGLHVIGRWNEWGEHLASHNGVSGEHLHIHVTGDKVIMTVIQTTNGTYYKKVGERSMKELPVGAVIILQSGDMIGLGRDDYNDPDFVIVSYEKC